MLPESIDLCENYHTIVKGYATQEQTKLSDIRNYYMSDSLIQMKDLGVHYNELIEKAVFQDKKDGAAYITSMTKAYFKDGSVDFALKFFETEIKKRKEIKVNQDEHLVKLFDSTFGLADKGVNLESFTEKYASLMMVRERTR